MVESYSILCSFTGTTCGHKVMYIFTENSLFEKCGREAVCLLLCLDSFHWLAFHLSSSVLIFVNFFVSITTAYIRVEALRFFQLSFARLCFVLSSIILKLIFFFPFFYFSSSLFVIFSSVFCFLSRHCGMGSLRYMMQRVVFLCCLSLPPPKSKVGYPDFTEKGFFQ